MKSTTLENCIWLGGSGYSIEAGTVCHLLFSAEGITIQALRDEPFKVPMLELCSVEISGPGTVVRGGGIIGGGFGVDGAIEGIAVATLLNALTTKTKIHTFLLVITNVGEFHLHYSGMEPSALRIALSHTFTALRRLDLSWKRSRISIIEADRDANNLSNEDFERMKSRLLFPLPDPSPKVASGQHQAAYLGPVGRCPSCRTSIPLNSKECSKCKALFGEGSSWQVIPT